jgi:hypothetical protein
LFFRVTIFLLAFGLCTASTFIVKPLFHGNPGLLQGASVALAIDNALYVGTATGDRLLKIPSVELSTPFAASISRAPGSGGLTARVQTQVKCPSSRNA